MPSSKKGSAIISAAKQIEQTILLIRGQKVMLDRDLADLYGVETKQLKRAVRRNVHRFPPDFMFELTRKEYNSLRSQFGTFKRGAHSKYLPMAKKVSTPKGYPQTLEEIKNRVRAAQYEALKAVNRELVALYWDIGSMIAQRQ